MTWLCAATISGLMTFKPWTFITVAIAGWMNRQQQQAIQYLRTENKILREKLGQKRIILNDSQRRRLATAGMKLGKELLRQFGTLFSPETILTWHRKLVARKYDGSDRRGKRGPKPTKANMIRKLVLRMNATCSDTSGLLLPPCIRWSSPWRSTVLSSASPARGARSACS